MLDHRRCDALAAGADKAQVGGAFDRDQVANGQVRAENITFAEIADAPARFLARHASGDFIRNCAAVWRPLVKDGLQEVGIQGKPFMTGLFGKGWTRGRAANAPQQRKKVALGASRGRIAKSTKPGWKNVLAPPSGGYPVAHQSHGLRRGLLSFALTGWRNYALIPEIRSGIGESATFMSHTRLAFSEVASE